jgi:hypothetical protein
MDATVRWIKRRHVRRWREAFVAFVALAVACSGALYWQARTADRVASQQATLAQQQVAACRSGNMLRGSLRDVLTLFQPSKAPPEVDAIFAQAFYALRDRPCQAIARQVRAP